MLQEQVKQTGYALEEAKAAYYPSVEVQAEAGREFNDPAAFNDSESSSKRSNVNNSIDVNLSLRQMIFDRARTSEIARREKLGDSKRVEAVITEQDVMTDTVNAYLDVLAAQKEVRASADVLKTVMALVEKVRLAYEGGAESRAKFDFSTARLALAKSKYNKAVAAYKDSVSGLETLTGVLPAFTVTEPEELEIQTYDLEFYRHLAANKNSDVVLIDSNIEAASMDLEKQKAAYLPKVDFVIETGHSIDKGGEVGHVRDASAMVQVKYDIFKGFQRRAAENRVASRIKELSYEKEDILKDVRDQVQSAYHDINSLHNTIEAKKAEARSYISLREINRKSVEEGEVDLFEAIKNEEDLGDALLELSGLQDDLHRKSYEMLRLIGALKKSKFCESCKE